MMRIHLSKSSSSKCGMRWPMWRGACSQPRCCSTEDGWGFGFSSGFHFEERLPVHLDSLGIRLWIINSFVILKLQIALAASFSVTWVSVAFVSPESNRGNTKPRRVGHAREAVPHWGGDQDVGHSLLCNTETVQRRNSEVRHVVVQALDCSLNGVKHEYRNTMSSLSEFNVRC